MNEELERKKVKAEKYAKELERFEIIDFNVKMKSKHDIRYIKYLNGKYECTCDWYIHNGICSHIMAIQNILKDIAKK